MASSVIHLAVAKKVLESHPEKSAEKVLAGALYPDTVANKDISHYTDPNRGKNNIEHLKGKVRLYAFLKDHPILDDFTYGWFIHLVTDYLFFSEMFSKEYLTKTSYKTFCKDLYYGYDCLNNYLTNKYEIQKEDYKAYPGEYYEGKEEKDCIFTRELLDDFIQRAGSIDYDAYILKIKQRKQNIKPEE